MRKQYTRCRAACLLTIVAVSALVAGGCDTQSSQLRLKLAHSLSATHPVHAAMVYMNERLQLHSGGKMALDIYPNSQLGSERELIELLQIGSLAMAKVSASPLEGFLPEMKIFNIPYLFRNEKHYESVLDSRIGKELLLAPQRILLRGLGYYDAGSRSFYTVARPIETPDDLDGMKIRVQQSPTAARMMAQFGAAATPIAWGELYTALQQGVVDGAENNLPSFYLSGHYEVAKFLTLDEHTAVPDMLLISKYVWEHLTPEQRGWLQTSVDESVAYQRKLWQQETAAAMKAVKAAGVRVIRPDKSLFIARVEDMYELYDGTEVGALIERIKAYDAG